MEAFYLLKSKNIVLVSGALMLWVSPCTQYSNNYCRFHFTVPQIPLPSSAPPTAQLSSTTTPKLDTPTTSAANGATGGTEASTTDSKKKEKSSKPKAEKGAGKREKKGAAPEAAPVDVSRLDLRIGKIIRAWKHPDADSLYVEEGKYKLWEVGKLFAQYLWDTYKTNNSLLKFSSNYFVSIL